MGKFAQRLLWTIGWDGFKTKTGLYTYVCGNGHKNRVLQILLKLV